MGKFDKLFGFIPTAKAAPYIAAFYAVVGFVFMILCSGRWIMPHAEADLAIPWAVVCALLLLTGCYGYWGVTKGNTWHHRQFVSASWGFILMFLCWGAVYIAVEDNHKEKVNSGCEARNPTWSLGECDDKRATAALVATIMVAVGTVLGIYVTLCLSNWVSKLEWEEHLERERLLELWRSGHGEKPKGLKEEFVIDEGHTHHGDSA